MNINIDNLKTNDDIEDLDSSWLEEFEKIDNEYKNYYTEDLSFIRIRSVYVNKDNNIEKLREEKILLKVPGYLQKEELISIMKHNSFFNQIKYSVLSILKYNINIEPIHLKTFLKTKNKNVGDYFLQSVKNIDTIKFEKSISMFHDINEIFIIFHEKIYKPVNNIIATNNRTKKVFINSNANKYTKRKLFKENMI
jgi:hypothetical protein